MYIVAALIFALIMVWVATAKGKRKAVNVRNGAHRLDIVGGFSDDPPIEVTLPGRPARLARPPSVPRLVAAA